MTDGRIGPSRFWSHGRLAIIRHTDGVFELLCEDIPVMGLDPLRPSPLTSGWSSICSRARRPLVRGLPS